MTKEEAMQLLKQVCAIYRGTLEEHSKLQQALKVVEELQEVKEEEKTA
jgi:predicted RNase H-like HicB family nuclease